MPREVTVAPPLLVTLPPADAVKGVIADIAVVVTVGREGGAGGVAGAALSFLQPDTNKISTTKEI